MRLRAVLLALTFALTGCLSGTPDTRVGQNPDARRFYGPGEAGGAGKRLIPYTTIEGFLATSGSLGSETWGAVTGRTFRRSQFQRPVAVAASPRGVYVLDGQTSGLYRFRWGKDGGTPEFKALRVLKDIDEPRDLYQAPSGDLYVTDSRGRRVLKLDEDGGTQSEFVSAEEMRYPVAVTVDNRELRIFVADGMTDRLLVFNPAGKALYGIGGRTNDQGGLRNIRDLVQGNDGMLYVLNGMQRRVQVYGLDGTSFGHFGQDDFADATGIAIDGEDRIYVSDKFNHRIVIFKNRKMVESYGVSGSDAGQFREPASLWFHDGLLYVADSGNGRVQVLKVVPENMLKAGGS